MEIVETPTFTRLAEKLMLFAFPKNERDDLTPAQLKVLRRVVEEEFK